MEVNDNKKEGVQKSYAGRSKSVENIHFPNSLTMTCMRSLLVLM